MKTLFFYFQQFSLPKVRKTRLQGDFVTNNQILVVKIIKIRSPILFRPPLPPRLLDFMNFSDPLPPRLLRPSPFYSGPKSIILHFRVQIFQCSPCHIIFIQINRIGTERLYTRL